MILTSLILFSQEKDWDESLMVSDTIPSEEFNLFLENFSLIEEFQISRIKFPLLECQYTGQYAMPCDKISEAAWSHLVLIDTLHAPSTITNIYDNFGLQMRNSGERVLAFEATETNVCNYYFFEAIEEKWYLVRIERCL